MASSVDFSARVRVFADRMSQEGVAALGGLFDLTSQRLVRYATAITRNQHDAEDAVQTSLTKVACQPHLLRAADRPWSYLLQIVRNEALQNLRKQKRVSLFANLSDLLTRCRVDELEQEDTHRAVWRAIRQLPSEQAEVVVLKIWEEMTLAQIADVLEISPGTVASRYRYAMEKLSNILMSHQREAVHG